MCLNPYCSGRWSRTNWSKPNWRAPFSVLILIVVEDGLVQFKKISDREEQKPVLILIVVEDGLVHVNHSAMTAAQMS